MERPRCSAFFFFFNDTATTEIYTLSLHDALPDLFQRHLRIRASNMTFPITRDNSERLVDRAMHFKLKWPLVPQLVDRKSTRLNSSHANISYAVFCLKKKKH